MTSYNSAFASHITAMLELRDSLGLYTGRLEFVMQSFDRYCLAKHPDTTTLTRELATQCREHDPPSGGMCTFSCPGRTRLHWVITGGESGPGARPVDLGWVRSIRDQLSMASLRSPFLAR
ncbi:MAG TPA: DUF5131 family protein [Nakamurella sp.]|nr:DUF5131 family protein [Nakamurella sp.]